MTVISPKKIWGQGNSSGRRRNIAESFAKTLGKLLGNFVSSKFHQNCKTTRESWPTPPPSYPTLQVFI